MATSSMEASPSLAARAFLMLAAAMMVAVGGTSALIPMFAAMMGVIAALIAEILALVKAAGVSFKKLVTLVTQCMRQIVKIIRNTNLQNAGMQMMNGLIRGMNSRKSAAIATARSIAQAINREYRKVQDIHSPSGEWEKYGAYQIQGDIKGMESQLPKLQATVQDVGYASMPFDSYTPESTATYSRSKNAEYNTYAPQFNLTISGTSDDRATERKVKRWIAEAMDEMFDSMSRKNPRLQEV